jgi:hypothetical protein
MASSPTDRDLTSPAVREPSDLGVETGVTALVVGGLIAVTGVVCGFMALWTPLLHRTLLTVNYNSDKSVAIFVLIMLVAVLVELYKGDDGTAMVLGAIIFGFFLFVPAVWSFDRLGQLGSGGWLGLFTLLIPIGALVVRGSERSAATSIGRLERSTIVPVAIGLVLCLLGLLARAETSPNYRGFWAMQNPGHTLEYLILILCLLIAAFAIAALVATERAMVFADAARFLAATVCGLGLFLPACYAIVYVAYLPLGGWLEGIGGLALLGGILRLCRAADVSESSTLLDLLEDRRAGSDR